MELTQAHLKKLEELHGRGFEIVAFPMYASYVGLRKGGCAVLIEPHGDAFKLFGQPSVLLDGNFSVRIRQEGRDWFVWKKQRQEATPEIQKELDDFRNEVSEALLINL